MFVRRAAVVLAATITAIALSTASASAHFCFKKELNERAWSGVAGSQGFVEFQVLAFEFTGLCPEGIAVLAEAGGVEPTTLINAHGTMAGGRPGGNKAIGHLDFDALDAAIPDAIAACS